MKYKVLMACSVMLCYLSVSVCAQEQSSPDSRYTLEQVMQEAGKYAKVLQEKSLGVQEQEVRIKDAINKRLPVVNVNGMYARVSNIPLYTKGIFAAPQQQPVIHQGYALEGQASLNLYSGGTVKRDIAIRKLELEGAREQEQLTLTEVKLRCAVYFYELLRNEQFKQLIEQEIVYDKKLLKEISSLYKNGTVLKSDVLRAEIKVSGRELLLSEVKNNRIIASQQLNILMGRPDSAALFVDAQQLDMPVLDTRLYEDYLSAAWQYSFEMKLAANAIDVAALHKKQVKAAILPHVSLFANYGYNYPQIRSYPYADAMYGMGQTGVKVSMPVSNLYLNKHQVKAAGIAYDKQRLQQAQQADVIKQEVMAAYLHYKEALEKIGVAKQHIVQATESLRILRNSYFNQQSLLTDMLDSETALLQSKFDLTSAYVNAHIEFYKLLKVSGKI
ncbi:TolC family protein [Chitinophaga nivalis]|uniref:TolC family protein n=1 Tax=Chitinophaga nivalis TaxID=2991709 RepID=A0ABT3II46_9BACT|nr:TolC family protein [Chitinophaga nivalis]MCW3466664.1 TolC family protein [Chitinophaga nivalis]MCW3483645.1 TolC family protein [Chitinophaga nivalis]